MIDVQRMMKDMKKIVEETNTTVAEMKETILTASINNQTVNAMNITQIAEDLWYLIQSNIDKQAFQVQRMLADELDHYKGKGNKYMNDNIWEIQDLYIKEEVQDKEKGKVEEKEVILIKPYEVSESISIKSSILKYIKFVKTPTQTRIFQPSPYYQLLHSRREQDTDFWKEIAMALVDNKHNMKASRNRYPIKMFQEGALHEPFFIAIDNLSQVIISPNKKTVAMYMIGELAVLV